MKKKFLKLLLILFSTSLFAQADKVAVENNDEGIFLSVNGEKLMINGMNWGYVPIGTNYSYSLWKSFEIKNTSHEAETNSL